MNELENLVKETNTNQEEINSAMSKITEIRNTVQFVRSDSSSANNNQEGTNVANPDEIDIDDDAEDESSDGDHSDEEPKAKKTKINGNKQFVYYFLLIIFFYRYTTKSCPTSGFWKHKCWR